MTFNPLVNPPGGKAFPPAAPRLAGRWWPRGDALPAGATDADEFEALLEGACHRPTLAEAMVEAITVTSGVSVHQCHADTSTGETALTLDAIVFAAGERSVVHQIHTDDALAWSPEHAPSWYLLSARRELVEATLRLMRASSGAPEQVLRIPHFSLIHAKSQASGALSMWWQDRMREGHTPASARLLLGMTMDPLLWADLRWPDADGDAGDVPRFWWCHVTVHHPTTEPATAWAMISRDRISGPTAFICAVLAGDEVGEVTLAHTEWARWNAMEPTPTASGATPHRAEGRRLVLNNSAATVGSGGMSLEEILTDPIDDDALPASVSFRAGILGAWWEARLAEGHTPESARIMLALTAHPAILSRLRHDGVQAPFLLPS